MIFGSTSSASSSFVIADDPRNRRRLTAKLAKRVHFGPDPLTVAVEKDVIDRRLSPSTADGLAFGRIVWIIISCFIQIADLAPYKF
ncbi:hypothetical protein SLEP1_g55687 [Rubroshorea leprosula]|uniref:Uncharacterized protein n=1 Tax=Rubroshorea leprosula TaxID=152421 RepID=A0AAV5MH95_9ROSI|nr:hypothetical protein SLEP1_g55687 [Rubroshorea leprosula]